MQSGDTRQHDEQLINRLSHTFMVGLRDVLKLSILDTQDSRISYRLSKTDTH